MVILNGICHESKKFDSKFTFFRGNTATQIDICITNSVNNTEDLTILHRNCLSDHTPVAITLKTSISPPLELIESCASKFLSYEHYDVSRKLRQPVRLENCDLLNLVTDLERLGNELLLEYDGDIDTKSEVETLNTRLTDGIYEACRRNRRKKDLLTNMIPQSPNLINCNSQNLQAIADAHAAFYNSLTESNDPRANTYKETWLNYQEMAFLKSKEELQENNCKQWKHLFHDKPKKMWELVDWKKRDNTERKELSPETTAKFFKGIFQAEKIKNDPKLSDATKAVDDYTQTCDTTDADITENEVDKARAKMKRGTGIDGISPSIMSITPKPILSIITKLYNSIFGKHYPDCWNEQLLLAFAKKDHSRTKPSLRGIGIGPILSRMFDVIINTRFGYWYVPNKEQAGFRAEQGCLLQILAVLMLIDLSKRLKKDMVIGVIDYEKAFDFTNRYRLCQDLMDKKFGKRFIQNFMNSYKSTSYIVKASSNERGESISTDQGLTQGKTTSSNYFSLYVSDMPNGLADADNKDFMDPFNLFQLADDTTVIAEVIRSFIKNMSIIAGYSLAKLLRIHLTKSQYLHLTNDINNKFTEDIILENIRMKPIIDGYNWLGFWLTDSNEITDIIENHLKKKMIHVSSFYSWLAVNEDTPFIIKALVLYNCLFATLLYSCEVWTNLPTLVEKLIGIEKKALKSCMGIKQSTPDDIIYQELNKADIIASIKDRQLNFYNKLMKHDEDSAIVIGVWNLYNDNVNTSDCIIHYFQSLQPKNKENNTHLRKQRIDASTQSMTSRYKEISNLQYCDVLYQKFVVERYRITITRWRMSCHKLRIETGRYTRPKTPRNERKCKICNTLEDEHHALFLCSAHIFIRQHYTEILSRYTTLQSILHPSTTTDANTIGKYLIDIENNMTRWKMIGTY